MSKVVFISEEIKKGILEGSLMYCTTEQMKTIISDYNSDSGISKNDMFILGFSISLLKKNCLDDLEEFGRSGDRLFLDNLELLIKSIIQVDHETSLHLQNQTETHYYDLHVYNHDKSGYSVGVKMECEYGKEIKGWEVTQFAIDNNLLDEDERRYIDNIEEISDEDYKQLTQ